MKFPLDLVRQIGIQIAIALHYTNDNGYIHANINPKYIMFKDIFNAEDLIQSFTNDISMPIIK